MSVRGYVRFGALAASVVGALSTVTSCYRVEVDLAPLVDDESSSGGRAVTVGAGEAGMTDGAETDVGARSQGAPCSWRARGSLTAKPVGYVAR